MFITILLFLLYKLNKQKNIKSIFTYTHPYYNFQCNTIVKLTNKTISLINLKNKIIKNILKNSILSKSINQFNLSDYISCNNISNSNSNSIKQFNNILNKTLVSIPWKITLIQFDKTTCFLLFQNHRKLMGGQKRIWSVINHLLDNTYLKIKKTIKHESFELFDVLYYLKKILLKYSLSFNYKTIQTKYSKKQTQLINLNLSKVKQLCKQQLCTVNDFCIAYSIFKHKEYLFNNKNIIRVFVPYFYENQYNYFIIKIPKKYIITFDQFLNYIVKKTLLYKLNNYKYIDCLVNHTIKTLIPQKVVYNQYINTINNVDVFISNICGFMKLRSIDNYHVDTIFSTCNFYNRPLEISVNSYDNQLSLSFSKHIY